MEAHHKGKVIFFAFQRKKISEKIGKYVFFFYNCTHKQRINL